VAVSVVHAARRLVEHRPSHRVVSLYLDLDPERFATPPARASQIRSLVDEASRAVERGTALDHEEKLALREDLDRINSYLLSREPPFQGARALAVFCSQRDELFEVVQLTRPAEGGVVIERTPYVEPLIRAAQDRRWCVALVTRRTARILTGRSDRLEERHRIDDNVHGQHDQGGWSQANYERSYEKEADDHLRRVAEALARRWRTERFDRLALGGPIETVSRLENLLTDELRSRLSDRRVDVEVGTATEDQIRQAIATLVDEDERRRERAALDRLAAGIGTGGRATGGPEGTLEALNERRVETLLLETGFDARGARCPSCGLLSLETHGPCPADGTEMEEVEHLREAAVEAALAQDAAIIVVSRYRDLGPFQGIGALLRF
jgi:peptide chain release factor subunit 1